MREDGPDRAAQVAHVLHGVRAADAGEPGCALCNTFLCTACVVDEIYCTACYERELKDREAEREREEARHEWLERARHREGEVDCDDEETQWWKQHGVY